MKEYKIIKQQFMLLGNSDANLIKELNEHARKGWSVASEEIKKISIPILIINGDTDLQVSVTDAQKFNEAKTGVFLMIIPKMNHFVKEDNTLAENQSAYGNPSYPLSGELVSHITKVIIPEK